MPSTSPFKLTSFVILFRVGVIVIVGGVAITISFSSVTVQEASSWSVTTNFNVYTPGSFSSNSRYS